MHGMHTHDGHAAPHADHSHSPGESYAHVRGGPSVLDIGGDIGALIVTMRADDAGTELHLRREAKPDADIHTGVWRRDAPSGPVTTAVFAELPEGRYWVLDRAGRGLRPVEIHGGELESIDLSG
jgi:hypothetical protein